MAEHWLIGLKNLSVQIGVAIYFFGDFGKIGLVLGNSFVQKEESDEFEFANFDGYTNQVQDLKERPVFKIRPSNEWNFTSIYELTK